MLVACIGDESMKCIACLFDLGSFSLRAPAPVPSFDISFLPPRTGSEHYTAAWDQTFSEACQ